MNRVEPNRNVYVGHRYVPLLVGEWDKSIQYEGLSIVTYKGASYTSKKMTPPGIDIENEEYWVLTGNYDAQVEYYRLETKRVSDDLAQAKIDLNNRMDETVQYVDTNVDDLTIYVNDEVRETKEYVDTNVDDLTIYVNDEVTEIKTDVSQRGVNINNYHYMAQNGDWSPALNHAIKTLSDSGGGKVVLPNNEYNYSDDIHFMEDVTVEGVTGVIFKQVDPSAQLIFYSRSILENVNVDIMEQCNQSAVLFDNSYLRRNDTEKSRAEGVNCFLDNVSLETVFNPNTPNKTVFEFFSSRSDIAQAHGAGFARVNIKGRAANFNVGINIHTDLTGWVNGNNIDMAFTNFVHAVVANKSPESLGVDYNRFNLYLQTSENTRDIFIDNTGISNIYDGSVIWDMEHYPESRTGNVILTNVKNGTSVPKERYHQFLRRNRYHLMGRFDNFTSRINHVLITVTSYENYKSEYYVRGGSNPLVERRRLGGSTRLDDDFDFYIRELENGQVELYIHNPNNVEVEATFYIDSYRSFNPSPLTVYEEITNLTQLDVVNYYVDTNQDERVIITNDNDFDGTTPRSDFKFGITYSSVGSSIPEGEKGTPNDENGLIVTHKIATAGSAFNYQEFFLFGSSNNTSYRRYGNDNELGWGEWHLTTE